MYKRIVVGTDGSERAQRAVDRAAALLADGGTLHVLHAFQPMSVAAAVGSEMAMIGVPDTSRDAAANAESVLQHACSGPRRQGLSVEQHMSSQSAAAALLDLAEMVEADAIVVGNRGMAGARRILGSVPAKVSHHADCDVVIVST